ncbi:MAG TPA: hypothetical protein VK815_12010 [Candidatus Acidoferrales bacterium]|jgi:hypothetical protein|nr:hypothetical protein [Candidatus Acidoferrales bacterium]
MKALMIALSLMTATFQATAGISSGPSDDSLYVLAVFETKNVAVSLAMPADFVSVPIRITSDQKNTALAYEESHQAIELVVQKARETGQFRTSTRVVSLTQYKSSFGISSGPWNQPAASADIYLLVPLTKKQDNIFDAGAAAARFVEALHLPGKVRCELGSLQLAVENPEQYRTKLLGAIAEQVKATQAAVAPKSIVKLDGLESSVIVRQAGDRNVELLINYSLSITTDR